jgi:hypothetical protein
MGDALAPASGLPPTPAIISGVLHGLINIAERAAGLMAGSEADEDARLMAVRLAASMEGCSGFLSKTLDAAAAAITACLRRGQLVVRPSASSQSGSSIPSLAELQGTLDKCRFVQCSSSASWHAH